MATIVCVHGTNAGSPDDIGTQWWQQQSAFQERLAGLVTAESDSLKFVPFHWSGQNSENARRQAARDLFQEISKIDKMEEFAVVGHSHGGSVVYHALFLAYAKNAHLPNMKAWCTVGTPHVHLQRAGIFIQRFNVYGQILIISLLTYALVSFEALHSTVVGNLSTAAPADIVKNILIAGLALVVALLAIRAATALNRKRHASRHLRRFNTRFAGRLVSLFHRDDEAIAGLANAQHVDFDIVPYASIRRTFVMSAMLLSAVSASYFHIVKSLYLYDSPLPAALYDVTSLGEMKSPDTDDACQVPRFRVAYYHAEQIYHSALFAPARWTGASEILGDRLVSPLKCPSSNGGAALVVAPFPADEVSSFPDAITFGPSMVALVEVMMLNTYYRLIGEDPRAFTFDVESSHGSAHAYTREMSLDGLREGIHELLRGPVLYLAAAMVFFGLAHAFAFLIIQPAIWLLNRVIIRQIKNIACGNDAYGEAIAKVSVDPKETESGMGWTALPERVGDKVRSYTETFAVETLNRVRQALGLSAAARGGQFAIGQTVSDHLSWRELIHTAYFDVEDFIKIVALALVDRGIVSPTSALTDDPDISALKACYASIKPSVDMASARAG